MTILREAAQNPEIAALFAALSPDAQRVVSRLIDHLDSMSLDAAEATLDLILDGAETRRTAAAEIDRALAERFPTEFGALSPAVRRLAVAVEQDAQAAPAFVNDDPIRTLIDDGSRSGIRLERCEWPDGHEAWLDFHVGDNTPGYTSGRVMVSTYIYGAGRQGLELTIAGHSINSYKDEVWTLADLRQLRDDLDRVLRDERLAGALAEQH